MKEQTSQLTCEGSECFPKWDNISCRGKKNSWVRSEDVVLRLRLSDIEMKMMSLAICRSFKYMADKTRIISQPLLARLGYGDHVNRNDSDLLLGKRRKQ